MKKNISKAMSVIFAISVIICILNMIDFPYEFRFIERQFDYLFVTALCILLPAITLLWVITCLKEFWYRLVGILVALSLIPFCYFIGVFAYEDYKEITKTGIDKSFLEIERLSLENKSYVLYRTNGGATTSYGLVLRTEYVFSNKLKVIHRTYSKYKAYEGSLKQKNDEKFALIIEPYSEGEKVEVLWFTI